MQNNQNLRFFMNILSALIIVSATLCVFAKNDLAQRRKGRAQWPKG
jgi:hypothetical protein